MKILALNTSLKDLKGNAIKESENGPEVKVSDVLIAAVSRGPMKPEEIKNATETTQDFKLAKKVGSATEDTDFTVEELSQLKEKVCKLGYSSIIAGQVCEMLDGN